MTMYGDQLLQISIFVLFGFLPDVRCSAMLLLLDEDSCACVQPF